MLIKLLLAIDTVDPVKIYLTLLNVCKILCPVLPGILQISVLLDV